MAKELTVTNPAGLQLSFSPDQISLLKNTVAKGADDTELQHFIYLAQRYNLDPFSNEIWFIKRAKKQKGYNNQWDYKRLPNGEIDYTGAETVIMTSRDGYLKIGQADPNFKELNSMEIRANDDFSYNPMTKEIRHNIGANRGAITGAWAICSRKDREPAVIIVDFNEYRTAVGKSSTWDKYPSAMIRKVAEVIVLKRQFNISGLVTREEMAAGYDLNNDPEPQTRKDITPQDQAPSNVIPLQRPQQPENKNEPSPDEYKAEWIKYAQKIKEKREILGLSPERSRELFSKTLHLDVDPNKWTLHNLKTAYAFLDDLSKPATYTGDKETDAEIDRLFPTFIETLKKENQQQQQQKDIYELPFDVAVTN